MLHLGRLLRQPRLWAWLFWLCLTSVTALALLPDPDGELPSVNWDKGNHLIAFGTLAFLARLAYPGQPAGWLFLALCAWGGVIELLQTLTPYRLGEWRDLLADAIGALLVFLPWQKRLLPTMTAVHDDQETSAARP